MKLKGTEPGLVLSGVAHAAMLAAALVSFSDTRKLTDATETIPVEMITDSALNEIMQGVKTAQEKTPQPPIADKVAEIIETRPKPVVNEAKVDVATAPPPAPPRPEPGQDDAPAPVPPQQVAALPPKPEPPTPPVRPEPPKPEPAKVEPPKANAEPINKPEPPKPPAPPKPPVRPKPEPVKPAEKKPDPKPLKPDQIASLLAEKKKDEPQKPAARPKSGQETSEPARKFNPNDISRLLSKEDAAQRASTGRAVNQTASLGAPNANASRMSPSLWGALDGFLQEQYKRCWSFLPTAGLATRYVPQLEVNYLANGALAREPKLRNPPSDPSLMPLAESALRAVKTCNPLRVPAQFQPYYNEWKDRILRFDPEEMMG